MQRLLTSVFPKKSTSGWAILGLFILGYDVVAMALNDYNKNSKVEDKYETLSDGCWRGVDHPIVRWPIWLTILILVKHLAVPNFLRKYDPIGLVGITVRWIRKVSTNG